VGRALHGQSGQLGPETLQLRLPSRERENVVASAPVARVDFRPFWVEQQDFGFASVRGCSALAVTRGTRARCDSDDRYWQFSVLSGAWCAGALGRRSGGIGSRRTPTEIAGGDRFLLVTGVAAGREGREAPPDRVVGMCVGVPGLGGCKPRSPLLPCEPAGQTSCGKRIGS